MKRQGIIFALFFSLGVSFSQTTPTVYQNAKVGEPPSLATTDSTLIIKKTDDTVVRNYNHTEQVITASVFMLSLILLMSSMNNFNPKHN